MGDLITCRGKSGAGARTTGECTRLRPCRLAARQRLASYPVLLPACSSGL